MANPGQQVAIEYTLKLDDGSTVDTNVGGEPLVYEQGAQHILPALEAALATLAVGDSTDVTLSAEDGYGVVNAEAIVNVPRETIPEESQEVGMGLQTEDEQGRPLSCRVHEILAEEIALDFNHPLAGQALHFAVQILSIE